MIGLFQGKRLRVFVVHVTAGIGLLTSTTSLSLAGETALIVKADLQDAASNQTQQMLPPLASKKVDAEVKHVGQAPVSKKMFLRKAIERQPLTFLPAPSGSNALYLAQGDGFSMSLEHSGLTVEGQHLQQSKAIGTTEPADFERSFAHIEFEGADPKARVEGLEKATAYTNYFVGSDPSKWRSRVNGYNRVRYKNLYPGIDLVYYGETHRKFEYDLVVAPGADPGNIRLRVSGDKHVVLDKAGDLLLDGKDGQISLGRPLLYQDIDHGKRAIAGSFVQLSDNEFGFRLQKYDRTRPLIIDPTINLLYSTYLGGNHDDEALDITVDSVGNSYLTGYTGSANFLVSANAIQQVGSWTNGGFNAFVMKFDASGTLLFSTMLGGTSANYAGDQGEGVRVDPNGTVYVTGYTQSSNFPVTSNAFQSTLGGGKDVFFAALSSDGSQLIYSTYLGGAQDEDAYRMVEDANGAIWLAGSALGTGLPVTTGVYQSKPNGAANGFIAKLGFNSAAAQPLTIEALTFLGGSSSATGLVSGQAIDEAFADGFEDIAFDSAGNVYVAGATTSSDFPSTANAYQSPASFALSGDGTCQSPKPYSLPVISELSSDLKTLLYSTTVSGKTGTLGGGSFGWGTNCRQYANTVHPDGNGNIWVLGYSTAADFPTTGNAFSAYPGSNSSNITITELTPGSQATALTYSSYLGSVSGSDAPRGVWDGAGNIWISALAGSGDWPGVNPSTSLTPLPTSFAIPPNNPTITELSPDGTKILYATYLGGSKGSPYQGGQGGNGRFMPALDAGGNLHLAGSTTFIDYPLTPTAFQSVYADGTGSPSGSDAVYTVLGTGAIGTLSTSTGGNTGDVTVTITGAGFASGATCTLVSGGTTITATSSVVNTMGTGVTCAFALNGAAAGSYDISVVNPNGGGTFTKQGGFTVNDGGSPTIWADLIRRSIIRTSSPSTFYVTYGNSGNEDGYGIPATIQLPSTFTVNLPANSTSPYADDTLYYPDTSGSKYLEFVIPHLAPGQSISIPINITDSTDGDAWTVGVTAGNPAYSTLVDSQTGLGNLTPGTSCSPASGGLQNCLQLNAMEFASYVNGVVSDMATADGFTYDANQAATVFANYYIAAVTYSISQSAPNPLSTSPSFVSALTATNRSSLPSPMAQPGQTVSIPIGLINLNFNPGGSQPFTVTLNPPNLGDLASFGNPVTGALASGIIGPLQDFIAQKLTSGNAVCLYAGGGQASVFTGKTQQSCGGCVAGSKVCTDQFQCKGLLPSGQSFLVWIPGTNSYVSSCNPKNPKVCKQPAKSAKAQVLADIRDLTTLQMTFFPRDAAADDANSCGGGMTAASNDPNYKAGPTGDGSASQYVRGSTPLPYAVGFENEATATLPAAQVIITDQLDPNKVDLSTLTLGTIAWGNITITPPAGTNNYNTTYNLNSSLNVRIQGSLNQSSGLLRWTFTSIDPTTGQPPTDPTVGFLPPDTDGIVGQGGVLFNVMPKSGLATGTQITNTATVIFDANQPINTPAWMNTLDVDVPVSKVAALPTTESATFPVSWSGTDQGSGISSYDIYVSDNGSPFTLWNSYPAATTSDSYTGTAGHTYGFYSIATDGAGNAEPSKNASEATTTISGGTSAQAATMTKLTASTTTAAAGTNLTFTATVTPTAGSGAPTGSVTFMDGTTTLGSGTLNASGQATYSTSSLAVGSHSITGVYGGDSNFTSSTSPSVTVVISAPPVDFTLSLSPTSGSTTAGQSVTTAISITPTGGFNQQVSFTCSGLPAGATCSFSPTTVTPSGSAAQTTLTIKAGQQQALLRPGVHARETMTLALLGGGLFCFGSFFRRRRWYLNAAFLFMIVAGVIGCGGSSSPKSTTSAITVTAAAGSTTHSATYSLTIQ